MTKSDQPIRSRLLDLLKTGKATEAFEDALKQDKETVAFLFGAIIKPDFWTNKDERLEAEKSLLRTAMTKLRKCQNDDERESLLRAVAMLFVADVESLQTHFDADDLEVILANLRLDKDSVIRGQATLASVKFLEAASDRAQSLLTNFVVARVQKQNTQGLIEAFSAASALFPIMPSTGAALFLAQGFVADLKRLAEKSSNPTLRSAALELLSAACTDSSCREAISKECTEWLEDLASRDDTKDAALSALILAKTQYKEQDDHVDLLSKFKQMTVSDDTRSASIEGLAYRSNEPKVKEELCSDPSFLKTLIAKTQQSATKSSSPDPSLFGTLTILHNLTIHKPKQSAEQHKMAQLKAYANKTKLPSDHPLESDEKVNQRCAVVIESGAIALLIVATSKATQTLLALVANILSSLTIPLAYRGTIAQQGGFDLAFRLAELDASEDQTIQAIRHQAAMALARILVKLDPHLLFGSKRPPNRAIKPLRFLLSAHEDANQKNLWPMLESLMALTNLASLGDADESIADNITRECWDDIEIAMLSQALAIRRAAVQCVCNLCSMSELAIKKYTDDEDKQGDTRMKVLVAFIHEDEDRGVLLSAGAALASLLAYGGVKRFLKAERSVEKTVSMVKKPDVDAQLRALAMFSAMLEDSSQTDQVRKRSHAAGAVDAFHLAAKNKLLEVEAKRCAQLLAS